MRTDLEYLKGMLDVFIEAEMPFVDTKTLENKGYDISSEKGYFHYTMLIEKGYVSTIDLLLHDPKKLGLMFSMNRIDSWNTNVRLTSDGYDFASALHEKNVFDKLKGISDQPISVLKDVGVELLKSYAKKKFGLDN
ncbi:hypothetical protein [Pantoea sp. NGS-ED-1003]|uniref:hypothetical protein n=1 Tax=Pantoea sp. NGS-ED-1003 TaxID=1526743 RepID=UPI0005340BCD|nr:hypothetical protein [Pantoea sp. NGS-ED-1003]